MAASTAHWFTSSFSGGNGNSCVEVAFLPDGAVGVRDTKDRTRAALQLTPTAWSAFLTATRAGSYPSRSTSTCS